MVPVPGTNPFGPYSKKDVPEPEVQLTVAEAQEGVAVKAVGAAQFGLPKVITEISSIDISLVKDVPITPKNFRVTIPVYQVNGIVLR